MQKQMKMEMQKSDTDNGKWVTYNYRNWNDWTDTDNRENKNASVEKYRGFYVGRYEAGEPKTAEFYNDIEGSTYWQDIYETDISATYGDNTNKPDKNKTYADTYKKKNVTTQKGQDLLPVSKKNTPSWNFISQENAKIVSENMYRNSKTINSYLIDGVAWDTITGWMTSDEKSDVSSTDWGNYRDAYYTVNGIYARHEGKVTLDGVGWRYFPAYVYNKGTYEKNYDSKERLEIATGTSERNKKKNIYDLAGNMWEWTTEVGRHGSDSIEYAVLRGRWL